MAAAIKAIVFKTAQLKETKQFFENVLHFQIKEASARHFVIYSKDLRIVFLESTNDFEIEVYLGDASNSHLKDQFVGYLSHDFESCKDPNGIIITISRDKL